MRIFYFKFRWIWLSSYREDFEKCTPFSYSFEDFSAFSSCELRRQWTSPPRNQFQTLDETCIGSRIIVIDMTMQYIQVNSIVIYPLIQYWSVILDEATDWSPCIGARNAHISLWAFEKHSGFGYECIVCQQIFNRPGNL